MLVTRILRPWRFRWLPYNRRDPFSLLEVGTQNNVAALTIRHFPRCAYYGLDIDVTTKCDLMAGFWNVDLDDPGSRADFERAPLKFDCVIVNHVLEHLNDPERSARMVAEKVADGGYIYFEYPSIRSLRHPVVGATFNVFDHPTHKLVPDTLAIVNNLLRDGFRIVRAGRRRDWRVVCLAPARIPMLWILRGGMLDAGDLADAWGSYDFIAAKRG